MSRELREKSESNSKQVSQRNCNREIRKKKIIKLSICAMLIGISVVIGAICRTYLTFGVFVRITFENLPIILAGILFGPIYGLVVGVCTDLVSSVITAQDINPIITLGALAVGFTAGLVSEMGNMMRLKPVAKKIWACVSAHFLGCLLIKTFGLQVYYFPDTPFWYLFGIRAAVYTAICITEIIITVLLLKNSYIKRVSEYEL